jgi:Na+/pantothenate symporter
VPAPNNAPVVPLAAVALEVAHPLREDEAIKIESKRMIAIPNLFLILILLFFMALKPPYFVLWLYYKDNRNI